MITDDIEGFYKDEIDCNRKEATKGRDRMNDRCDELTMVIYKAFDVTHDLYISLMCGPCHLGDSTGGNDILIPGCGGLGVEDEGDCEKSLPIVSRCRTSVTASAVFTLIHSIYSNDISEALFAHIF